MNNQNVQLTGRVVYKANTPEYNQARKNNNARFDLFPAIIVYCQNEQDVSNAVLYGQQNNIPLRVRSGGHNYEALSNADGALVIDLSDMHTITLDKTDETVWIEAGAPLGDVYEELNKSALTIPGGTCPWVRVGGLTQGGGVGFLHRQMGLTCDSLIAARIVTADGQLRTVEPGSDDADLLWALKGGGGGNFGVVTAFQYKTHQVKEKVTVFSIIWHDEDMRTIAKKWCQWAWSPEADRRLTTFLRLYAPKLPLMLGKNLGPSPKEATLVGVFLGPEEDAKASLSALTSLAEPESAVFQHVSYGEAVKLWSGLLYDSDPKLQESFLIQNGFEMSSADAQEWYKISSAFAGDKFDDTAVDQMVDYLHNNPADSRFVSLHALGGQVADVGATETAFAYRDQKFILQYQAFWTAETTYLQEPATKWVENFRTTLQPYTTGAFINFVDVDVQAEEYYNGNFAQLEAVKKQYDPNNVFKFKVSIPVE